MKPEVAYPFEGGIGDQWMLGYVGDFGCVTGRIDGPCPEGGCAPTSGHLLWRLLRATNGHMAWHCVGPAPREALADIGIGGYG